MSLKFYNTLTREERGVPPVDRRGRAHVRVRPDGLRLRPYRQRAAGDRFRRAVSPAAARLWRKPSFTPATSPTSTTRSTRARSATFPALPFNEAIARVTAGTENQYHEDVAALGCLPPTHEPRATAHIAEMSALIERLVARGVAYVAEEHVLFSPSAMDALPGAPRYGSLARRSLDEMLAGARVDVAPYKRDPMDFVLWKPSKPEEPGWAEPLRHRDARAGPAGTSNARPCRWRRCCARSAAGSPATIPSRTLSTSTAAASISCFPTTRTRSRSPAARSAPRAWRTSGCTTASCRSKARKCRRASAISSLSTSCCDRQIRRPRMARRGAALCDAAHALPPADRLDRARARRERKGAAAIRRDRRLRKGARRRAVRGDGRRARRRPQHAGRDRAFAQARSTGARDADAAAQLGADAEFLGLDLAAFHARRGAGDRARRCAPGRGAGRGAAGRATGQGLGRRRTGCARNSKRSALR